MTGEAHHRINWATAILEQVEAPRPRMSDVLIFGPAVRLVVGPLGGEWRARVFDDSGLLLFNEVALSSTKVERGVAVLTFDDGATWSVVRDGDCGCGN